MTTARKWNDERTRQAVFKAVALMVPLCPMESVAPALMRIVHSLLGAVYLVQSHPQEALAEMEEEKSPDDHLAGLALAYHSLGRKKESDANLAQLIAQYQADSPYEIAEVYSFRGEPDLAFKWLERAYIAPDPGLKEMKGDPLLRNLERDKRYAPFLRKMHLPV